ncbi:MAG: N-acetylmuramoyl-L-alanine amidase [Deltaproteobacteria bacterium]|nr:N-acetylmuramoyl-L-alanine amidase [Deltaproteobacteria bacterium]
MNGVGKAVGRIVVGSTMIVLCALGATWSAPTAAISLAFARIEQNGGAVELHFGFRGPAPGWSLRAQRSELILDLPATTTELPPRPLFGQEVAPVTAVRISSLGSGQAQIAIDVEGKTDYAIARLQREIVLRFAAAGTVPNLAAPILVRHDGSAPPPVTQPQAPKIQTATAAPGVASALPSREKRPTSSAPAAPQAQLAMASEGGEDAIGHRLVMIDPGHGGYDPGTSSASGTEEKDLALAIARRLERALSERGVRTEMTRTSDVFVPLSERTAIANRAAADLFVSIHLNWSPNPMTSGIEVYYLNNTTDRATIRLARMENAGAPATYGAGTGPNLNYILTDLRQQYKANEAASLARMIDEQAVAILDAGLGTNVNALGAKMGPFYVLVGAHMPAVLVETGFLSNAGEAQRLASAFYQEVLADGIATAITHYFNADVAVGNL